MAWRNNKGTEVSNIFKRHTKNIILNITEILFLVNG